MFVVVTSYSGAGAVVATSSYAEEEDEDEEVRLVGLPRNFILSISQTANFYVNTALDFTKFCAL